ncbi:pentapeptide repeat-containing protein [Tenacibaculum maritimum]|uniref:pentapeptide repeat-containing protein n=1 Tax=Tenacibaculum maritimum TaxID=107401 RepID=UPI0038769F27
MKKKALEAYFTSDKTSWFTLDEEKSKIWDTNKVSEFWERIREYKIKREDYDFSDYVFPEFEDFDENIEKESSGFNFSIDLRESQTKFQKEVVFLGATFLGNVCFRDCIFQGKVDFSCVEFCWQICITDCIFNKTTSFDHSIFHEGLVLTGSEFRSEMSLCHAELKEHVVFEDNIFNKLYWPGVNFKTPAYLSDLMVNDKAIFFQNVFEEGVYFSNIIFKKNVDFSGVKSTFRIQFHEVLFMKRVKFDYARIREKFLIHSCSFLDKCSFIKVKLEKFHLEDLNKTIQKEEHDPFFFTHGEDLSDHLVEKLTKDPLPPNLIFDSIGFDTDALFTRIDLRKVELYNCDVATIKFSRCDWNVDNKRLVLKNENNNYRDSEIHYRQLKKIFDSEKNWEYSGYSYVSEMEMRKKRLWKEKKYTDWLIYKFYGFFGGYTQNYLRPLFSLFILTVFSSAIYYFIDYNLLKAIQRGLKGAIPYLEIDTKKPFQGYWLIWKNIQLMLSGTFIAFFILALRKRFKQ